MGGPGSSRWGSYRGKIPSEYYPCISLKDFGGGETVSGRMEWRQGIFGNPVAAADLYLEKIDEEEKELSLSPVNGPMQTIRITRAHARRQYFLCPCSEEESEETFRLKLYLVDGVVECRSCHNLTNLSHLRGNHQRLRMRAFIPWIWKGPV